MVHPPRLEARFRRGDRVLALDFGDGSVGVVTQLGAIVDADTGKRAQLVKVLFPIGSSYGAEPIWVHSDRLILRERPCLLCHGEEYLDADDVRVVCPMCVDGVA
jgi:hypothetical protein